ncbi:MAG: phosphopantetheine-binding protein [Phycisphaerae bacterium]
MSLPQTESETLTRLCTLAAEQAGIDPSTVTPDSDFYTDLNFDSLDAVEYVMTIEEEFNISIDDHQTESVRTPRKAYELLAPLAPQAPGP